MYVRQLTVDYTKRVQLPFVLIRVRLRRTSTETAPLIQKKSNPVHDVKQGDFRLHPSPLAAANALVHWGRTMRNACIGVTNQPVIKKKPEVHNVMHCRQRKPSHGDS